MVTMITVPIVIIILISLFTTGITANSYCDQQKECPCGIPDFDNCCYFKLNHFDRSPRGTYKTKSCCGGQFSIVEMYCDTKTADGGWTVIQRRKDGSESFHRPWSDYKNGFGDLNGEFWYGLRAMNCLTQTGQWELRVDFEFKNKTRSYLHYNVFKVGNPNLAYPLTIGGFTGITPTDPFSTGGHNGRWFSPYTSDNDGSPSWHCAARYGSSRNNGGWWYNNCWHINLNYHYNPTHYGSMYLGNKWYNPRWIEMKIRPHNCQ